MKAFIRQSIIQLELRGILKLDKAVAHTYIVVIILIFSQYLPSSLILYFGHEKLRVGLSLYVFTQKLTTEMHLQS